MSGREAEEKSKASRSPSTGPATGVDESGVVAAGSSEMELFRAGKLTREEFISKAAERATSHLEGQIEPERLEDMRALLRSQLDNDPTLTDLVDVLDGSASSE